MAKNKYLHVKNKPNGSHRDMYIPLITHTPTGINPEEIYE